MNVQNLTDGRLPTWRHGRTWIGRNYRFAIEWSVGSSSLGVGVGARGFSIRIPPFALYVSRTDAEFFGREFDIHWMEGRLWINHPFERDGGMEWRSSDPWWKKAICLHVVDWLIGRPSFSEQKGQPVQVFIPMPEGSYRATATPSVSRWRRRWYWPDRVRHAVWLEIPGGGIPHSGKGENSWDCGDDGLCGIGGDNIEDAIANAVRSVLESRRRHGLDSRATGREPVFVANAEKRVR